MQNMKANENMALYFLKTLKKLCKNRQDYTKEVEGLLNQI